MLTKRKPQIDGLRFSVAEEVRNRGKTKNEYMKEACTKIFGEKEEKIVPIMSIERSLHRRGCQQIPHDTLWRNYESVRKDRKRFVHFFQLTSWSYFALGERIPNSTRDIVRALFIITSFVREMSCAWHLLKIAEIIYKNSLFAEKVRNTWILAWKKTYPPTTQ